MRGHYIFFFLRNKKLSLNYPQYWSSALFTDKNQEKLVVTVDVCMSETIV